MGLPFIPIWKEAPFIRLVIPFIIGIITESFFTIPPHFFWVIFICCISGMTAFVKLKLSVQFRYAPLNGIFIHFLFICIGGLLTCYNDTSKRSGPIETTGSRATFIASLKEPVSVKARSYKSLCAIKSIQTKDGSVDPRTNIIIYFRKDSTASPPSYGDRIAFAKSPERIKNIPGANGFDYVQYCARQNIYFQVFLNPQEYTRLNGHDKNFLSALLFSIQSSVIGTLQNNIPGKKESGLAEALLIGYKDDLDKQLIQSYSNTGVVHVVAISGLHLGLIYGLLKLLCAPLGRKRLGKWLSPILIIAGLWLFSVLAGGSPSVLRSAVMFSFIVMGESISRKTSIFNNLAASAFFLLCYDPYWLWDIGFQLSYAALVSIVIFMKPIYHLYSSTNSILDGLWKLNAVTLAAQVLTLPVCIYYFHQFPTLFLLTNCIAVPLSSLILMGEIGLCSVSFIKGIAGAVGWGLFWLLKLMNGVVETISRYPFSTITGLEINFRQVIFMYVFIAAVGFWLIRKKRAGLFVALVAGILFMAVRLI